jgi:hypothetical protein
MYLGVGLRVTFAQAAGGVRILGFDYVEDSSAHLGHQRADVWRKHVLDARTWMVPMS